MSKHFCCCIPVRFAVFVFSLLVFLSAGIGAAACWAVLIESAQGKIINGVDFGTLITGAKIALGVAGGFYTIVTVTSLLGFIGSIARKRRLVKIFSSTIWILVFLTAVACGGFLYFLYSGKTLFKGCEFTDSHGNKEQCSITATTAQKIGLTVSVVVGLLLNIYIATVIGRYVEQLESERMYDDEYRLAKPTNGSTYAPTFYPQQAQETQQGLLNPGAQAYPYTDEAHRFGNRV
ncbi:hypothetical protein BDW22DRAFT_1356410 [Trametopsis cervina]|nr:hypothetical protein BDW22DRAFT_1356410 [Trametopsis cervina]